jgi:hypothetical protein
VDSVHSERLSQPSAAGGRNRVISISVSPRTRSWLTSRSNQNVVISMSAVRRAVQALKRVNDEQVLMWEAFWRASRFPQDHAHGTRPGRSA